MGGIANQREALQYAKNFQPFAVNHQKGKQRSMCYTQKVQVCLYKLKMIICADFKMRIHQPYIIMLTFS